MSDEEESAVDPRLPVLHVVRDGAGFEAWWAYNTEAARARVLTACAGMQATEEQLARGFGAILFAREGEGAYSVDLTASASS